MRKVSISLFAAIAVGCFGVNANAGQILDDILNIMTLGEHAPDRGESSETASNDSPIGQSFNSGSGASKLCRIAVSVPQWLEGWSKGESLKLTLYDSPAKKLSLGNYSMTCECKGWEDSILCFPLWVDIKPDTDYYFELSVEGGDGKIPGVQLSKGDYPRGQEYRNGQPVSGDLWFQTHVKSPLDRGAVYSRAFSEVNLNAPGLEKVKSAVLAKDWDTAAAELVKHFEARDDLITPASKRTISKDPKFDTSEADLAANQKIRDADGNIVSLEPDWNHLRTWPTRGGVGLTRGGLRKPLAGAYGATGDEKYAKAFNDMLIAYFTNLPSPILAGTMTTEREQTPIRPGGLGGGSMWAGLSTGARMGHGFAYYERCIDSPSFQTDTRAAFILELPQLAKVLSLQKGDGNWATMMTDSLFSFGQTYPEFKSSPDYFRQGYDGLIANMRETLNDDGPIRESMVYQTLTLGRFHGLIKQARQLGIETPPDARARVEKGYEFQMYTMMPNTNCPPWGDGNGTSMRGTMAEGAKEFDRKDMLWIATDGKQGVHPTLTSYAFPISNYYVMRSDWTPDALYLALKNSYYSAHGHRDSTSFMISAYGNRLVIDPGIYIYGTPEAVRQNQTRSHSTISVDNSDIRNDGGANYWVAGKRFDYLDATGPGYSDVKGINNRRRILFVKPAYWVVSDTVHGNGEHEVASRYHLAANAQVQIDPKTNTATTQNTTGGNLAIVPVVPSRLTASIEQGDDAVEREKLPKAPIVKYSAKSALPLRHDVVLYPYKGLKTPTLKITPLASNQSDILVTAVKTSSASGNDYAAFGNDLSGPVDFGGGAFRIAARSAVVRTNPKGQLQSFSWAAGSSLSVGKRLLAQSSLPVQSLDVSYSKGLVTIDSQTPQSDLKVYTRGAAAAVVDGVKLKLKLNPKVEYCQPYLKTGASAKG